MILCTTSVFEMSRLFLWCAMLSWRTAQLRWTLIGAALLIVATSPTLRADEPFAEAARSIKQVCFECHNNDHAEAKVNLEDLTARSDFAKDFRVWRQAADMVEQKLMPPRDSDPLPDDSRKMMSAAMRREVDRAAKRHALDPGQVVLRRLTSAEYAYSVLDLTGLDLKLEQTLAGDAVGGEGFANVGSVQFMQDSTLEQYLDAAKRVANHAVIGTGPLDFFSDSGQSGFELSAITRIQNIYRAHGFRTAAGEGGVAFGLDLYPRSLFVAWQFRYREKLGRKSATLSELAHEEGIDVRFADYIWKVLQTGQPLFPTSDIVARWQRLPVPEATGAASVNSVPDSATARTFEQVRGQCQAIHRVILDWQTRFGQNADAKEEAPVLSVESFKVAASQRFEMNINWPEGTRTAHLRINIESANRHGQPNPIIVWHAPRIEWRIPDQVLRPFVPLSMILDEANQQRLKFGEHPADPNDKSTVAKTDFVTSGTASDSTAIDFEVPIKPGATSARLQVTALLDTKHGDDCIVRCTISQLEDTDQGKQVSALLANPKGDAFELWKNGVVEFARVLPQVSQREPAPSDRDPIPAPFDTSYNNAERNLYHYKIKYHRDDQFLYDNILDDKTRVELDNAWMDLLGSFEYHDAYLRFTATKFAIDIKDRSIRDVDLAAFASLDPAIQKVVESLQQSKTKIDAAFESAQSGHFDDVVQWAGRAWRRPLSDDEAYALRDFYRQLRTTAKRNHADSIRALLTRVLLAPEFLYRAEQATPLEPDKIEPRVPTLPATHPPAVALTDWEIASRLSYFLWASIPDQQLAELAAAGRLSDDAVLKEQTLRMLRDPKAKRLASEFFGQWFGFYRFDQYKGIDPKRFPEFDDRLKAALHDEAVSFFEHIVRQDRPVDEILFADYAFLNKNLAAHYGIQQRDRDFETGEPTLVSGLADQHRGGLFGLGAVLTVTSAPLRTSPVKRGDWVLRRVLGTPVPPPPADAGSIPADDVLGDGLSVRQRLAAHRQDAACRNCHARIDPLGFALENYDPIGRWRENYRDGQEIESASELSTGGTIDGAVGLREYLRATSVLFYRTLCTKLAGYALGRRESISDVLLIERMMSDAGQAGQFSKLVLQIVLSPQFRMRQSP